MRKDELIQLAAVCEAANNSRHDFIPGTPGPPQRRRNAGQTAWDNVMRALDLDEDYEEFREAVSNMGYLDT